MDEKLRADPNLARAVKERLRDMKRESERAEAKSVAARGRCRGKEER